MESVINFFIVMCGLILLGARYTFSEEAYCNTTQDIKSETPGTNETLSRRRREVKPDALGVKFGDWWIPWDEYHHFPNQVAGYYPDWTVWTNPYHPMKEVNGTALNADTPDFRVLAPTIKPKYDNYLEWNRYYRIQPLHIYRWYTYRKGEEPFLFNCYPVMVFKRIQTLSMGAILTYRHILTSALATDIVIRKYRHKKTLENILGGWHPGDDWWTYNTNSNYYFTPARVVYHPKWNPPEFTNRSVPLPCLYDLAVWTTTMRLRNAYGNPADNYAAYGKLTQLCQRWSNHWFYGPWRAPSLQSTDMAILIGTQMVMDIGRKPFPWFRYAIRTKSGRHPVCPKNEWDWYICIEMIGPVGKLGMEPGGILHVASETYRRYSGLAGLNSVSMKLRSANVVNYFTVIDRFPVLDFMYDAYKGFIRPAYLDARFLHRPGQTLQLHPQGQTLLKWEDDAPTEYKNYKPIYYKK